MKVLDFESASAVSDALLRINALTSAYGRIEVLHRVDFTVGKGQLVALVGANGAGKTTLLRVLSGVQPASGGTVSFLGEDITRLAAHRRVMRGICQVPEGRQVFGPMTVEDNLLLGAYRHGGDDLPARLEKAFTLFPVLKEKRRQSAGTLSGGQQQMVAIARALMGRPQLLLLDEPSLGLSPLLAAEILRVVERLKQAGMTILLVEQNARAALAIADVGHVIETGRIVHSGSGRELLNSPEVQRAYLGM